MTDLPNEHHTESSISFRPLSNDDLPRMLRWLEDPDVSPWYGDGELTLANLAARYADRIAGTDTTQSFITEIDGQPVGYIQCYRIADEPGVAARYARQLGLPPMPEPGAVGTDLLIGEATFRNRGWGAPILRAFHRQIVFGALQASVAVIAPSPENIRAIRTYEKTGFRWLKTVPVVDEGHPENTGLEYVMILTLAEFTGSA